MPYTQAGTAAIGQLGNLVGTNGAPLQQAGIDALKTGPLYGSLYNNGEEALLQNAAATGGIRSGNTQRGLADFGADTLAQVYQNQIGNLSGLAGLGMGATGSVAGAGLANANAQTSLYGNIGTAQATNFLTKGGINAANWNNAGQFLDQAASAAMPGAGGGFSLTNAMKSIF